MASKYTHDVVATTGTYKGNDGQEKKQFSKVGAAFTDEQGRISIKMDLVPCSREWSGWLSLYEPKEREQRPSSRPSGPSVPRPTRHTPEPGDDDIPYMANAL